MASFVAHHHSSLVEREGRMAAAAALRGSHQPCHEAADEIAASGPAAWAAGDRGLFGEGFSVEDLLDLEVLCDVDKDSAALGESPAVEDDKQSSDSRGSLSSVVSYELMPLPPPVIDLPAHDAVAEELEWVSRIMDDSLAELLPAPHLPAAALRRQHNGPAAPTRMVPVPTPTPTPTLCALSTEAVVPVKAKRSKRSRGSVWSLTGTAPLSDSTSSSSTTTTSSCSSSSAASFPTSLLLMDSSPFAAASHHFFLEQHAPPPRPKKSKHGKSGGKSGKPKKRGRKPKHHTPSAAQLDASAPAPGDRRCSHCGVNKTPQWRAGPEGAKTLCNACGVRYKSGRLLPEYRPACSPTFVSSIHSNSHRKVLEMRRKKEGILVPLPPAATAPAVASF